MDDLASGLGDAEVVADGLLPELLHEDAHEGIEYRRGGEQATHMLLIFKGLCHCHVLVYVV